MSLGGFCVLILLFRTRRVRDVRAQVPELVAEVKQDLSHSSASHGTQETLAGASRGAQDAERRGSRMSVAEKEPPFWRTANMVCAGRRRLPTRATWLGVCLTPREAVQGLLG